MITPDKIKRIRSWEFNPKADVYVIQEKIVGEIIESILEIVGGNYIINPQHPDPVTPYGLLFYEWLNKAKQLQGK